MEKEHLHLAKAGKSAPMWKKLVAILVVVSMPLFFSYYRGIQTERAANFTNPENVKNTSQPK